MNVARRKEKYGAAMSKTIRGSKGAGFDYWGRRPCTGKPGRFTKRLTHRAERRIGKNIELD